MANKQGRRATENALRDTTSVPVNLLYDETNDKTIMARGSEAGRVKTEIVQDITTSTVNTTTTNLTAGATFTGTAESTLGINGLQFFARADQPLRVYLEQGIDGTTWDISDYWDTLANVAEAQVVYSVAPYFRLRVTNTGTGPTTDLDVAAGMTPIINPMPRKLSSDSRLSVETTIIGQQNENRHVFVSELNALSAYNTVRLVGTNFDGVVKDTAIWSETVTGTGSITQAGSEIKVQPGATANSTARYFTNSNARFVVGRPLRFLGFFALTSDPIVNNIRRIGAYDGATGISGNGFFIQVNGTTFGVGYRKGGADTVVTNGNLNGNYGPTWNPVVDQYYRLEIEYGLFGVYYYVDGILLHTVQDGHLTNFLTLPVTMEVINSGGQTADAGFDCVGAAVMGQGELITNPNYYHISGNAATHLLKVGAGILQRIVFNNTSGTAITIYDDVSATANIVGVITTASAALGSWTYMLPFNRGLTLVTTGNSLDATVIYE